MQGAIRRAAIAAGAVVLPLGVALIPAAQASAATAGCTTSGSQVTCVFLETGSAQTWDVPTGVTSATFTLYGAKGGGFGGGGSGAEVTATTAVSPGTTLQVNVGQGGAINGPATFGGGGTGSGSGGGASDIRTPASDGTYPLANRLLVAGGGGGGGVGLVDSLGTSGANADSAGGDGPAQSYLGLTLGGGGGGGAGSPSASSAPGGTVTGTLTCTGSFSNGMPGGSGGPGTGGSAGDGTRGGAGGGGGGYYGGGGGGGEATAFCLSGNDQGLGNSGGGAGGGGSSYTGGISGATVTDGVAAPDDAPSGEIIIRYSVPAVATATTVAAPGTGTTGTPIAPSATLTGASSSAGGTITFTVFGPQTSPPSVCTTGGTAAGTAAVSGPGSYTPLPAEFTPGSAGTYYWHASYSGDAGDNPSNSGCGAGMVSTVVTSPVVTTSTTVTSSANPSIPGQAVTYTATVSPTDGGGTLTFSDGGTQVTGCSGLPMTSSGQATCEVTYTAAGSHTITAAYSGDTGYAKSTSTALTQQVVANEADLKVKLSVPARAADGASVTETVTVTNDGPAPASKIVTALTEPPAVTVTNRGGSAKGRVLTWTTASLAPGASVTFTVTGQVRAHARGTIVLAAGALSATHDPNLLNNVAIAAMRLG